MNKAPSNQGSSSGIADVKYQKAIKEISKLISLNTSLKKQIVTLQENYDKLRTDYEALQQKYNNMQFEIQQSRSGSSVTASASNQQKQQNDGSAKKMPFRDNQVSGVINQCIQTKRKISDLQQKIVQKEEKITNLKRQLEQKNQESGQLYRKYLDVTQQLTKAKSNQNIKNIEAMQKQRKKLKKQLQQSQQWVRKITNDYELLKKQIIFNDKSSISARSIELGIPLSQLKDPLSQFYSQKLRKSEAQKIMLKKQLNQKKMKFKQNLRKLRAQNQQQLAKLMHLTSFTQKQQAFIQKFLCLNKGKNT